MVDRTILYVSPYQLSDLLTVHQRLCMIPLVLNADEPDRVTMKQRCCCSTWLSESGHTRRLLLHFVTDWSCHIDFLDYVLPSYPHASDAHQTKSDEITDRARHFSNWCDIYKVAR